MYRIISLFLVAGSLSAAAVASAENDGSSLAAARSATAKFQRLHVARSEGYGILRDADGIACIDNPGVGGMGVHYVNGALVGNADREATTPEALVYEPGPNGRLRLVALEYVVFQSAWDKRHADPPMLFGQTFELVRRATATACRPSTSCTLGSGSTIRTACSTTGTRP